MHKNEAIAGVQNERRPERNFRLMLLLSGAGGCIALIIYFLAPFVIFPFLAANDSSAQIVASATNYELDYLLAAWLQGTGTFLIIVFVLGLVFISRGWERFAGWITMVASVAILTLSLNEGTFFINTGQAVANGHPDAAVTSFELTFVFIHAFFVAPSLFVPFAFVLRPSPILPAIFWLWALVLGIAFTAWGLAGLFVPALILPSILLLVIMLIWV